MNNNFPKIAFLGDICFSNWETSDIDCLIEDFLPYIEDADYRIVNLECVVMDGHTKMHSVIKTGPSLKMDEEGLYLFKKAKFTVASLANNHIGDYGEEGIRYTIERLADRGILYIGAGKKIRDAYKPLHIRVKNTEISVISICENEFGVASNHSYGSAGYLPEKLFLLLAEEKQKVDYLVVIFHGGNEHNPLPSPRTCERYRSLIDMGAAAVVASHPHCPQGYEYYKAGVIVYSLGNFFFPLDTEKNPMSRWNIGYVANISFIKKSVNLEIVPYQFKPNQKKILPLVGKNKKVFQEYIEKLNYVLKDEDRLKNFYYAWSLNHARYYAKFLQERNWIEIQNLFRCEAHRELMQTYFELLGAGKADQYWEYQRELNRLSVIDLQAEDYNEEIEKHEYVFQEKEIIELVEKVNGKSKWKKVCICGAGLRGREICNILFRQGVEIISITDSDKFKWGNRLCGIEIMGIEEVVNKMTQYMKEILYLVTPENERVRKEIIDQLMLLGILDTEIIELKGRISE